MKLRLFLILLVSCISQSITVYSGDTPKVLVGLASHIGERSYQEDRARAQNFIVNGIQYHLAMVCDGHGGSQVSEYTVNNLGNIIQEELKNDSNVRNVLLKSFAKCEQNIIATQKIDETQPGSTVVLSLLNLTKRKRYIANLGDSRWLLLRNNDKFEQIFATKDHTNKDTSEQNYVKAHGGSIECGNWGQQGVFLKNNPNELKGVETPRALGDRHLKTFIAEDGTVGPVNPVPDISEYDLNEDELEIIVSDGFIKHIDWPEYSNVTLATSWNDICNLPDEEFYNKYKFVGCLCKTKHENLNVDKQNCLGNDDKLKEISRRLIFITRCISESHATHDNITVLVQRVQNLLPKKEKVESIFNKLVNRYTLGRLSLGVVILSLIYYQLYYQK